MLLKEKKYYKWIVVALLWGVALLNYLDRQMLSTMRPSMQIDIAELQSATSFGHLMAVFLWIYGLMSPVSGIIADREDDVAAAFAAAGLQPVERQQEGDWVALVHRRGTT